MVVGVGAVGGAVSRCRRANRAPLATRQDKAVRDSTRYANFLKDRYHAEAVRDTLLRQVNIIRSLDERPLSSGRTSWTR